MKFYIYIILGLLSVLISACQDEELNPNDIKSDEEVKDNYVVLKRAKPPFLKTRTGIRCCTRG
ncbi:MAG: hypothetical protein IPO65_20960 [Saprospiraceae bacterium]|nr:hypothetical protein [Saprospiraceae bacterium]